MKLVTISTHFNLAEAGLACARLEAAEFHPFIANENAPCTLGGFSDSTLIRVEIPEAEFAAAKEFLDAPTE